VTRNLIVDGQILQTGAWHRGMGKYLLQVLQELNDTPPRDTEVWLLFNSNLVEDPERLDTVAYLYPNIKQIKHDLPLAADTPGDLGARSYRSKLNHIMDEDFAGADNFYLLTSLFLFDFFAEFPANCHKLLLFYDLTPLMLWRDLGGYFPPNLYMPRFQKILEAEQIFAISDTTRKDLLSTFGLPQDRVTNINGGFTKIAENSNKPAGFKVPQKYILFPTGDLPHKNNEVAVRGFERYIRHNASPVPLLITSRFSEASKEKLLSISQNVIFTGNVDDEELEWLYEHASCVLFASKYEGLGMPVLDAVASKIPVIASRISVFEEMSKEAFYYFDADDPESLYRAYDDALKREDFESKAENYPAIMKKYTWSNTANDFKKYINQTGLTVATPKAAKPKIAVVCLSPGIKDQIGRLSEPLHFSFRQHFRVDYFFDANGVHFRDMERPTFLDYMDCKAFDIGLLNIKTYKDYDAIVYLLDGETLPSRVAQRASVLPGVAIFGDSDGLDRQAEMIKRIILENQISVYDMPAASYRQYQKLIENIKSDLENNSVAPHPAEAILRHRGTNRSIIRKLKALFEV
jgi:glycosyltransferase involved in cell wall biosynthesis